MLPRYDNFGCGSTAHAELIWSVAEDFVREGSSCGYDSSDP